MITRKEYMENSSAEYQRNGSGMESFRAYYGQFVSEGLRKAVVDLIGADAIKASTDPHMNDIPLAQWDRLRPLVQSYCLSAVCKAAGGMSLSDAVCIAKEAARQWQEANTEDSK